MADIVELIPGSERDEAIFRAWEAGKGPQVLAREFGIPVTEVERILDRCLPAFDAGHNLYAFKRELRRLEDLSSEFFIIAKRDKDRDCAHLVARLNERICAMRGFTSINIRMDPLATQSASQPSRHEKIREAIFALAGRTPPPLADGNASVAPSFRSFTLPYQPSPKTRSGRPAHRPFRGLLGAHSRCGLHTRAVTVFRDTLSEGFSHFVTSIAAPVASGWSVCRVGFAPTGKRRLVTAHGQTGH